MPAPILDGNVKRVLARYHAVEGWPGKTAVLDTLWRLSEAATPEQRVGDYNQAMMDLGATRCTRGTPACGDCPLRRNCRAFIEDRQRDFPAPRPRRELPVREAYMLLLAAPDQAVYLEQRPPSGIWGGLWSFPEFDSFAALQAWCDRSGVSSRSQVQRWDRVRHTFSHFHLDITPCCLQVQNPDVSVMEAPGGVWYNTSQSKGLGLAAPVQRLLARLQNTN